jgi:hypothetical protein
MAGFTKLFNSILDSTIWSEDNHTRLVWITMLAMADRRGHVDASVPGLAIRARVPISECEQALAILAAPDKYSRSSAFEGRRIETIEGGWRLLNYLAYRRKLSAEERREYFREYQRERRASQQSTSVHTPSACQPEITQEQKQKQRAEADPEADPDQELYRTHTTSNQLRQEGEPVSAPRFVAPRVKNAEYTASLIVGSELRRHGQHAYCGQFVPCVPLTLDLEFAKVGKKTRTELIAWYTTTDQAHETQAVGDDGFSFWRNLFAAWIGTVTAPPSYSRAARMSQRLKKILAEEQ